MDKSLSFDEIVKIATHSNRYIDQVKLITSDEKHKLPTVAPPALKPTFIVIHYQSGNTGNSICGHWSGLIVDWKIKTIYFYDSYGFYPDSSLDLVDPYYRVITDQWYPHIRKYLDLMKSKGYRVEYNQYKHQRMSKDINTCGRWVGIFFRDYKPQTRNYIEYFNELQRFSSMVYNLTSQLDKWILYRSNIFLDPPKYFP